MQLTVVFEHWHLGDGNYPAFSTGEEARLSFELYSTSVGQALETDADSVRQIQDADYEIVGRVIRSYQSGDTRAPLRVLEAEGFRFYCTDIGEPLPLGARVRLRGRLALDHYEWVEFLDEYPDSPDLFYGVRVVRIRQVRIPEQFIQRLGSSLSYPAAVSVGGVHDRRSAFSCGGRSDVVATGALRWLAWPT